MIEYFDGAEFAQASISSLIMVVCRWRGQRQGGRHQLRPTLLAFRDSEASANYAIVPGSVQLQFAT